MRVTILILATLTISTIVQDDEVLIQQLAEKIKENFEQLSQLDIRLQTIKQAKLNQIAVLQSAISDQKGECYKREQDVEAKQTEIDLANDYINWMIFNWESNNDRISLLSNNVCEKNNNFLYEFKSARVLLRLIAYQRAKLQDQLSKSLTQVNENRISELQWIVNAYKEYRKMNMLQIKQEDFELSGTIEQLIELLNQMKKEIQEDVVNGLNGQVQIGVTLSEFKFRIENENDIFNRQIELQDDLITHFQNQLISVYDRVDKCQSRLKEIEYTLLVAEEDLRYDQKLVDEHRLILQEEIELFDGMMKYTQSVIIEEHAKGNNVDSKNEQSGQIFNFDSKLGTHRKQQRWKVSNAQTSSEEEVNDAHQQKIQFHYLIFYLINNI
ncbi:unnamed protein product [Paramecium pentaurelia]|uniref:Uncharacterized protein n=1 Tax=Paramecium pentaurelia TaxID=43138 RepID=A0A8S1X0B2_9CILI|nr:unnamed protein product [Paramecium pentaurelia]